MKLISDYKDNYDAILHNFRDDAIVFNRKRVVEKYNYNNHTFGLVQEWDKNLQGAFLSIKKQYVCELETLYKKGYSSEHREVCVIVFCGKIFPFFISSDFYKILSIDFKNPYSHFTKSNIRWRNKSLYLEDYDGSGIESDSAVLINKEIAPIVLIAPTKIEINPILRNLHFHMHVNDIAQNLIQFLSPKDPEIVEVNNNSKIQQHGFDEISFRREKGGPTRKRKKNKI